MTTSPPTARYVVSRNNRGPGAVACCIRSLAAAWWLCSPVGIVLLPLWSNECSGFGGARTIRRHCYPWPFPHVALLVYAVQVVRGWCSGLLTLASCSGGRHTLDRLVGSQVYA
jgi:hypothetical protein